MNFRYTQTVTLLSLTFWVQVMCGFHSMVQHTRTTVLWAWRTLETKMVMLCSAWLTSLPVADVKMGLLSGIGSSPMELEFPVSHQRISTEPDIVADSYAPPSPIISLLCGESVSLEDSDRESALILLLIIVLLLILYCRSYSAILFLICNFVVLRPVVSK